MCRYQWAHNDYDQRVLIVASKAIENSLKCSVTK